MIAFTAPHQPPADTHTEATGAPRRTGFLVGAPTPGEQTLAPKRLLTCAEVAAYLFVHRVTVLRLVARGDLPRVHLGRAMRFRRDDVERFIDAATDHR